MEPEPEPEVEPEQKPEAEEEEDVEEKEDKGEFEDEGEDEDQAPRPEHAGSATALVAQAYSIIGSGYQWSGYTWTGSVSSSAFTCSGVVDFAMGLPTNSSTPEGLFEAVGSNLVTSVDALSYGDLVFYTYGGRYPGHVGIYVGGGQIIDSIPNGGVAVRDVDYMDFIGGGPIL
jgi:cell wall-associated NlpC family hydrolase